MIWALAIALALWSLEAAATSAIVVKVYDGDTITVEADIWPGLIWRGSVRVDGVDTPEIRAKCPEEKVLALKAKAFVLHRTPIGSTVELSGVKRGKYAGRVVAKVEDEQGRDLTDALIAEGLGRRYDGAARESWCP